MEFMTREHFIFSRFCLTTCVIRTLGTAVLETTAKLSHTRGGGGMIWKVLLNLRMILLMLLRVLFNQCSNVIRMLISYYVEVLTLV